MGAVTAWTLATWAKVTLVLALAVLLAWLTLSPGWFLLAVVLGVVSVACATGVLEPPPPPATAYREPFEPGSGGRVAGVITNQHNRGAVGGALVMTAAGLAVAIPAVLAYNVFGKFVGACEAELEGFAHDLREMFTATAEES